MTMKRALVVVALVCAGVVRAQDSVDITFRYNAPGSPSTVQIRGDFTGWATSPVTMNYQGGPLWTGTVRLPTNPTGGGIPGANQYKFWYPGVTVWPNDPLNHHVNPGDNDNTFVIVRNPTIYHFLPNQRSAQVTTNRPTISAYIFPRRGSVVDTSTLALTVNGVTYTGIGSSYNFSAQQLAWVPPSPLPEGVSTVILRAGTTLDTVSFVVAVSGPPIVPLPSYAKHGVTLPGPQSNDSTTFRLRVGSTNYVLLRVAPAGQPVASAPPVFMRKDPSSDNWWTNLALAPGTYEYLYQTSSGTLVFDPWGRHNGTYGSRFTVGPEGLSADDYAWRIPNFQRPPLEKLVVYEMNVGEFAGGWYGLPAGQANFTHMKNLMGYFDSLGVNAIELMPVNDYGLVGRSGHSWGYDLNSYFALEPGYGTPRDFKILVDSAHARGVAVIVDVVFNHINDTGPLWQMEPSESTSPYFKLCTDLRFNEDGLCFFRDMDHWTPETQEIVYEALKMWIDVYKVDGFRFDYTQGIGWNTADTSRGILGWVNRIAREYDNSLYLIAEHLPESPALIYYSGLTSGWHDSFRDEVFDEARFRNRPLTAIENLVIDRGAYPGNDFPPEPSVYGDRREPVNATNNHDEQSLLYEMITFQGVPLDEALVRDRLYGTLMFTSVGVPMLWQGTEFSEPRGWPSDNLKLTYRPVQFSLRGTSRGQVHERYYRNLIRARKINPALHRGALRRMAQYAAERTLVWGFEDLSGPAKVMAVANFSGVQQTVTAVPWLAPGTWYDIQDQSTISVPGTTLPAFTIPAYTARVFSSLPDSVLLPVAEVASPLPADFALEQNYPNPFNPSTTIQFSVQSADRVRLIVYDALGREVAALVDRTMEPGTHTVRFDAGDASGRVLPSGVYFYRMTAGSFTRTRKLVLVR
jgi:1,4-alpha-glucan branching enzyme